MKALLGFLLALVMAPAFPLTVTDDAGAQVTFDAPPQRVVTLAPHLAEMAYAAGIADRLVGVSAFSDYPPGISQLPRVGDAFSLDWERLVALQPDMVLAWKSSLAERDRAEFEKLGLKLLVLEPHRLGDIPKAIRLIGRIANTERAAETAALAFDMQHDLLRKQYAARPVVRAYFQIAATPLLTFNGDHIISDVLRLCGAQNAFSGAQSLVLIIPEEALVSMQPEILLGLAASREEEAEITGSWRALPVSAAQHGMTGFVPPDLISRPSPRILQGARQVCEQVDRARQHSAGAAVQAAPPPVKAR